MSHARSARATIPAMRTTWLCALAISGVASVTLTGCGTPDKNCTVTYTVTPTSATLDHTVAKDEQTYTLNIIVPPNCPEPPKIPVAAPQWSVSNTTAATITNMGFEGVVSCKAAAASPITVSAGLFYPSATLICK